MTTILQAMSAAMADIGAVAKKDKNTHQGFNFRGIDATVNACAPAFHKHGIVVVPTVNDYRYEQIEVGAKRTLQGHVIVNVTYTFYGPEGDHVAATVIGESSDSGDKAVPKAMSVAFRTALLQALALPTDEPDPDSDTYERSQPLPKASDDQFAEWVTRMNDATDLDSLNVIGVEANKFDLTDEQRNELRSLFIERRKAVTA